jgi:molecular chaperone GrpE (heat shock protein)
LENSALTPIDLQHEPFDPKQYEAISIAKLPRNTVA